MLRKAKNSVTFLRHLVRKLWAYLGQIQRYKHRAKNGSEIFEWLRYFPDWQRSVGSTPLSDRRPWITYGAINFLSSHLRTEMRICEYGVGGSTLFFVDRVSQLISIEHHPKWAERLKTYMPRSEAEHWHIHVITPKLVELPSELGSSDYLSDDPEYKGMSFENYVRMIDGYPDDYFDVVQIDGRARVACVKHAVSKIKRNGFLILDDAHRERYENAHRWLGDLKWLKSEFFGPVPNDWEFASTCVWQRTS